MRRVRQCIAAVAITLWAGGCEWVLGIEDGKLRPEKPAPDCNEASDCDVDESACRAVASCTEGKCVYQDEPEGKPLAGDRQTMGDCLELVCDGEGKSKLIQSETDADDGNPCTVDACYGSMPEHMPQAQVACYSGPSGTNGVGICRGGILQCTATGVPVGTCAGEILPAITDSIVEKNGFDDDCDGQVDEDSDCGDGIVQVELGEECDDGGTADGDPCSPTCKEQRVLAISTGGVHTCALLSGGIVKCWGVNSSGQLGLAGTGIRGNQPEEMGSLLPPVDLGTNRHAVAIASGGSHTCAILDNQTIKCWGMNDFGQLGQGDNKTRGTQPGEMGDALTAIALGAGGIPMTVTAGGKHTCVLLDNGTVKCWGANTMGQLGLGDILARGDNPGEMGDALPPVNLGSGQIAIGISAAANDTCALLNGGHIKCWGSNSNGQLGLGDVNSRGDNAGEMGDNLAFVQLGTGTATLSISSLNRHRCVRVGGGMAKCWGENVMGELGLGDTNGRGDSPGEMGDTLPPINLGPNVTVVQIVVGAYHSCALFADGSVKCWGSDLALGLGDGLNHGNEPGQMGTALPFIELGSPATSIAAGYEHNCALLVNGSVKCWGGNDWGQLGLGDTYWRGDEPNEMGDNLPTVKLFSDKW